MVLSLLNKLALETIKMAHSNQDNVALQRLGVSANDAKLLADMSLQEIDYVQKSDINCIEIKVDSLSVQNVLDQLHKRNAYEIIIHNAIILGAPYEVMLKFTKLSRKQYSELRKHHGIQTTRATELSEEETLELSEIINAQLQDKSFVKLFDLIEIASKSRHEIVTIYAELKENWGHKYDI